jgi:hypothetical protein
MLLAAASGLLLFGVNTGRLQATRITVLYAVSLFTAWSTPISLHDALICLGANIVIFLSLWNVVVTMHMQTQGPRKLWLVLPHVFGALMAWVQILDKVDVTLQLSNWAIMTVAFSLPVFRAHNYRPGKTAFQLAKLGGNAEVVQVIARETQIRRSKRGRMTGMIGVR